MRKEGVIGVRSARNGHNENAGRQEIANEQMRVSEKQK